MKKKQTYSMHLILRIFFSIILLTAICAAILIIYIGNRRIQEQMAESNHMVLTIFLNDIDKTLSDTNQQLLNLFYNNKDVSIFEKNVPVEDTYSAGQKIMDALTQISFQKSIINCLWFYHPNADDFIMHTSGMVSKDESSKVQERIYEKISDYLNGKPLDSSHWFLEKVDNEWYLMSIISSDNSFYGGWIKISSLQKILYSAESSSFFIMSSLEGTILNNKELETISFKQNGFDYVKDRNGMQYLYVSERSKTGAFTLSYLTPIHVFFNWSSSNIIIVMIIALDAILIFISSVFVLQKILYRPLLRLNDTMVEVQNGNLEPQIKDTKLSEFKLLNTTFTYMLQEIKNLKIDVYEQTINNQRIKRQFLQIQLKSHFYLNCLNIIYSLAQAKNYQLIQDLTRSLGEYFRYIAGDSSRLNILQNELEHIRSYMHIQEIRFPKQFMYYEDVSPFLLGESIPPLILHTFVENAIEHAIDLDKKNWIQLTISPQTRENCENLYIVIEDNGKGFSQDQLRRFNNAEENTTLESFDEIGINNVKSRLKLLDKSTQIVFSNRLDGGACVELWIPLDEKELGEFNV